jgi:hypothetical protein
MAELTYRDAVARGIAQEMTRDPDVIFFGEDVGKAGGVFKSTVGLYEQFGPRRVRDCPISEQAILGAAMGAAMTGLKPIAEIMFSDFFAVCFDYIANEFPKSRYMSNGQLKCPLVVRTANGAGSRFGAQHSQSVENWAMMIPGLKVVAPSTPRDVIGLLAAAVRDPDPVIFFEHKSLYATKGEVPDGEIVDTLGTAKILRLGQGCDDPGAGADGAARARGGGTAEGGTRYRRGSRRRALAGAARHANHPRFRRPHPPLVYRGREPTFMRVGRRDRVDRRRRSVLRSRRPAGAHYDAAHPAALPPTRWKMRCCRRWTGSPRRCGARCKAEEFIMAMYDNLLANVPTDLWIGGKWRKASDGARFDVIDPATENKIASVASASVEDAKAAIDAAQGAFEAWAAKKPRERGEILRKAYELIVRDAERFRQADHHRERQGALRLQG